MNTVLTKEVLFIFILSIGLLNHVIIIPSLLEAAGRDAWVSVFISLIPYIFYIYLISIVSKKIGKKSILVWVKETYGKTAFLFMSMPFLLILIIHSFSTLIHSAIWVNTYFLPETSLVFITLILTICCYWITCRTFKQLTILATVVLPIVVILGFFIMSVNIKHKDMENLFPIFLNGYLPMLNGVIYSLSGLVEIFYLLLIQQHLTRTFSFKQILLLGLILVGLTLGPLSAAIMEFGPITAANLAYPAYEEWKLLQIGDFVSRLDFFAVFQWMSGTLFRISLFVYILSEHIMENKRKLVCGIIYLFLFGGSLVPISSYSLHHFLYNFFLPFNLIIILLFSILLSLLVLIKTRKGHRNHAEET